MHQMLFKRLLFFTVVFLLTQIGNAAKTPNILLIYIDDMGYSDLSITGNPHVKTPCIDKLASEGTRFTQYYSNSPICSPSRVAVATGHYPGRHRFFSYLDTSEMNHNRQMVDWLDPSVTTMAKLFQEAGYATSHIGKWHMGGGREVGDAPEPSAYGFDEHEVAFEGLGPRVLCVNNQGQWRDKLNTASAQLGGNIIKMQRHERTAHQVDMAIDFIKRHQSAPFYLQLCLNDVHTPYIPSDAQLERVKNFKGHPFLKKLYAVLIDMDLQVGRLIDALDAMDLSKDTLVVLTSDNGPNVPQPNQKFPSPNHRTGDRRGSKWSLYEGGINLPFIVRWPGRVPAGKVNDSTMHLAMDFLPTFTSIANIARPKDLELDGTDMSAAYFGETPVRTTPVFWEFGRIGQDGIRLKTPDDDQSPTVMIRNGKWKILVNDDGSGIELYDFSAKPNERKNVAVDHPEIAERLKQQALNWFHSLPLNLKTHDGSCLHKTLSKEDSEAIK
jgi:arylsulfatase A-like enzyme